MRPWTRRGKRVWNSLDDHCVNVLHMAIMVRLQWAFSIKLECRLCTVGGEHREEIGVLFLFDNIFEPRLGAALGQWGIGAVVV